MLHLPSFFSSAQIFRRKNRNHNWLVESAANGPVCHRQGKPRQGLRGNSHLRPCRAGVPPDQAGTRLAIYPFVLRLLFVSSSIKNRRTNGELSNNYRRTNEEMTTLPAACQLATCLQRRCSTLYTPWFHPTRNTQKHPQCPNRPRRSRRGGCGSGSCRRDRR